MASVFNRVASALLEVHAPLKCIEITSHHAPWITADLRNLMKERDSAKKKLMKMLPIGQGMRLRNTVNNELRRRVQEYYHNLVEETQNNPKAKWTTINKVLHENSHRMVTQK